MFFKRMEEGRIGRGKEQVWRIEKKRFGKTEEEGYSFDVLVWSVLWNENLGMEGVGIIGGFAGRF